MLKTILNRIIVLTVLTAGLVSCAKEKAPETITDQFSLGTPEIRSQKSVLYASDKQINGAKFLAEDEITFPKLARHDFEKVPVWVATDTSCAQDDQVHQAFGQFPNKSSIRLKDIIPATAFAPNGVSSPLSCIVNIKAVNKFGSKHDLTMPILNVTLDNFGEDLPLQVDGINIESKQQRVTISAAQTPNLKVVDLAATDAPGDQALHLICEHFHSQISQQTYNNYGFSKLLAAEELPYKGREFLDKARAPRQLCRILRETLKPQRKLEISPVVEMQFELSLPQISSQLLPQKTFRFDGPTEILSTTITNPHSFGIYVAILQNQQQVFGFRFVSGNAVATVAAPIQSPALTWNADQQPYFENKNVLKFFIFPGKSLKLKATADIRTICGVGHAFQNSTLGLFYDLDPDKLSVYVSTSNQFERDPDLTEAIAIPSVARPQKSLHDSPLPGWIGFKLPTGKQSPQPSSVLLFENVTQDQLNQFNYKCTTFNW